MRVNFSITRTRRQAASLQLGLLILTLMLAISLLPLKAGASVTRQERPVPLFAYYYIWFDTASWDRAKVDFPVLGRYSSDDREVMQEHVRLAKLAGLDGFIVSWKSTEVLNRRLEQLIEIADDEDFKLAIIYQGLDFERRPQPVTRIAEDLDFFIDNYSTSNAFSFFKRPVVIWSGSWEFSRDEMASVIEPRRQSLRFLASERNVEGYTRVEDVVEGDAYYWSSVNPATFPGYQEKLNTMAEVIHADNGLWIAPAAPGFDARLIGGTQVVERKNGEVLRQQMSAAAASSPDAIGLISWNEFSENSHVEPSVNLGMRYLEVLAEIRGGTINKPGLQVIKGDFDSSEPGWIEIRPESMVLLAGLATVLFGSVMVVVRRSANYGRRTD